ncbi:2-polyprenyl-6-methoxyphenol hydroxylase-like FAD-dependent oxidoreductase [Saccharothrix tamanrassetensis]|uniref:2-polyprenyl-6-methoxyphenol hydroxylase-like FAD-dependent oxidoreductase n=1 Tax=Saccharothrix tamanrassetensis TaxID=1051531 RepID=A0A841C6G7_9PSEU|nr:FAD-dependent monooxygenase [Saccharothrix tamanrassetensis]MBB5954132.1 2-polyprenyl-6-methoxyphenol hydroxylase-like FAD-dependent oxidoreductase [Saccharothrix tamanrassetensis]
MDTDVVIVGAGPNGLMLANELRLAGVRPTVLEALPGRATLPKANGLVGRVVQALHYRGLHEAVTGSPAPPQPAPFFQFGALPLEMATLDDNALFILPVPQRRLEEVLENHAGVPVRRGHQVKDLTRHEDHVTLDVSGPDGGYELTARYVVGADGGHSVVRKRAGIGFPGITDDGFTHRTGQVVIHEPVADHSTGQLDIPGMGVLWPGTFHRTEHGVFAFGMFQPGIYRIAMIEWGRSGLTDTDEMPLDELREAAKRVLGIDLPMSEPCNGQPAALNRRAEGTNSRLADRYREGRVLLVGDAAHVHSGVGGPGLNLGLQDAINLGWKLAAQINGWAPPGLLDTYNSERRPVGRRVITHSRAQTALLAEGPNTTALREVLTELLQDDTAVRRISDLMSGADTVYDMGSSTHLLTGRWMPDLPLTGNTTFAHLARTGRPLLLDFADRADVRRAAAPWTDRVDIHTTTTPAAPADAVLVRPDGYVAWAGGHLGELAESLRRWFGDPRDLPQG